MKLDVNKTYHIDELIDFELPKRNGNEEDGKQYQFPSSIQDQLQEIKNSELDEGMIFFFTSKKVEEDTELRLGMRLNVERIKVIK